MILYIAAPINRLVPPSIHFTRKEAESALKDNPGNVYDQDLGKEKWAAATLMENLGGEGELDKVMRLVSEFMGVNREMKKKMLGQVGAHQLNPFATAYLLDRYYDVLLT